MKKEHAMNIARDLAKAVVDKFITEKQAKSHFAKIAYQYKRKDRFKELQKTNPRLWMHMCELRNK